ncbi:MAG: TlpA family protein disulfide reductase [Gammaproteobacteria bacterium]
MIVTALTTARRLATALSLIAVQACASGDFSEAPRPYDEKADARAAIAAAFADNPGRKPVLIAFGGNWCSDSRALEAHFQSPGLAPLMQASFRVVHVDVGMFHRNLDIVEEYGNPIDKGIPSVVLLDADGKVLFVNHGELSSARTMSDKAVREYFERLAGLATVD